MDAKPGQPSNLSCVFLLGHLVLSYPEANNGGKAVFRATVIGDNDGADVQLTFLRPPSSSSLQNSWFRLSEVLLCI